MKIVLLFHFCYLTNYTIFSRSCHGLSVVHPEAYPGMLSQDNLQSVIGNAAQRKGKRSSVLQQLNELKAAEAKKPIV